MFKHLKRKKPEKTGEPQIGSQEVNKFEVNPENEREHGRYAGRLLNPDDLFFPEKYNYPNSQNTSHEANKDLPS